MKKIIAVISCLLLAFTCASAHSGRTDAAGGHWDSSAGEYHYHHGYPAHQHTGGICPYDYDDQTGANSGAPSSGSSGSVSVSGTFSSDPAPAPSETEPTEPEEPSESAAYEPADTEQTSKTSYYEPSEPPEGYPNAVNFEIAAGSMLIDRTYYFNENGFMYTPFPYDDIPHGDVETDNTNYLQYDSVTIDQVVYQYGLENQSEQFQQGATFGIHEASLYYDQWYQVGYDEGQQAAQNDTASDVEIDEAYERGYDDGTKYGETTGYNTGYSAAANKYQWIIIIGSCISVCIIAFVWISLKKALKQSENHLRKMHQIVNDVCVTMNKKPYHILTEDEMNEILQKRR